MNQLGEDRSFEQRFVHAVSIIGLVVSVPALTLSWVFLPTTTPWLRPLYSAAVVLGFVVAYLLVRSGRPLAAFTAELSTAVVGVSLTPHVMEVPPGVVFAFVGIILCFSGLHTDEHPWRFPIVMGVPALVIIVLAAALHPGIDGVSLIYLGVMHGGLGFGTGLFLSTVRYHMRRRAQETSAHLFASDRMASIGVIAAGLGHEINNPLAYIQMNLAAVLGEGRLELDDRDALTDAAEGAARIEQVVKNLGFFARPVEDPEVVDVQPILRMTLDLVTPQIRHQANIELECEPYLYIEDANGRLGQIVLNLLTNAVQAIADAEGGRIQVRAASLDETVVIDIDDNGPGIKPDVGDRVFDSFFTTKPVGQGTGLGLSICRHLARVAGGSVNLAPSLLGGACLRIVLPRRYPAAPVFKPSRSGVNTRRAQVLIIDDDKRVGSAMARALKDADIEIVTSGAEGLEHLQRHRFDVVFCDAMMPVLSGLDVFRTVAAQDKNAAERFVFVTGGAYSGLTEEDLFNTGRPVLRKPVKPETLRQTVSDAVSSPEPDAVQAPAPASASGF